MPHLSADCNFQPRNAGGEGGQVVCKYCWSQLAPYRVDQKLRGSTLSHTKPLEFCIMEYRDEGAQKACTKDINIYLRVCALTSTLSSFVEF